MKIILKDKHIYIVENEHLAYNNIEAVVDLSHIDLKPETKVYYQVNDQERKPLQDNVLKVDVNTLKNSANLRLKFLVVNREGTEEYVSDALPITVALLLNGNMEEAYPEKIKALNLRIDALAVKLEEQRLQHNAQMLEMLNMIEQIDNKGSLL